jgi:uncharacterized peroxidase-related enzyme
MYARDTEKDGYVRNYTRSFSLRPAAWAAWEQLARAVTQGRDARRYELATLGAAVRLRSSYCALAHGDVLARRFLPPEAVTALATDAEQAPVDEQERAVVAFATKVAGGASHVEEADVQRLRDVGLEDGEVLDVVLAVAARCFFSTVLDATGTLPDATFAELDPDLREALTVGRPIARD